MKYKVKDIFAPRVMLEDEKKEITVAYLNEFIGNLRKGAECEKVDNKFVISSNNTDSDCVGGSCPIR